MGRVEQWKFEAHNDAGMPGSPTAYVCTTLEPVVGSEIFVPSERQQSTSQRQFADQMRKTATARRRSLPGQHDLTLEVRRPEPRRRAALGHPPETSPLSDVVLSRHRLAVAQEHPYTSFHFLVGQRGPGALVQVFGPGGDDEAFDIPRRIAKVAVDAP